MFELLFFTAGTIFLIGLAYKVSNWFRRRIGSSGSPAGATRRLAAAGGGIGRTVFGPQAVTLLRAVVLDVLLQQRVFKESRRRWLAHMLMFYGFVLLLLMHALQSVVTEKLFSGYYPTVNPFFFLRDFFGAMVLAGMVLAIWRRYVARPARLRTGAMDHYAVVILAVIILSGAALEGLKITSHGEFTRMVEDYARIDDEEEIAALEALWVKEYGLVAAHMPDAADEEILAAGREVHALNCVDCHAPAKYAFVGFAAAKLLAPAALWLDQAGAVAFLWHLHFIACFAGLAYLPFSKMFHLVATPVSLIVNRVMDPQKADPANVLTRRMIELDACTHCGSCSRHCSAAMMHAAMGNESILPSEKMIALKRLVSGKSLDARQRRSLTEGVCICTNCDRCTVHCPSGIRLKDLWHGVREELLDAGPAPAALLSPFSFARGLVVRELVTAEAYSRPLRQAFELAGAGGAAKTDKAAPIRLNAVATPAPAQANETNSFRHCFSCQNCTTVCPVVANDAAAEDSLGLLPHQIMCCLGLGLVDMAAGARMIWDCLTCYQCQENCPQQVAVCDLLFTLKNRAVQSSGVAE